jgi:hypothetical protein
MEWMVRSGANVNAMSGLEIICLTMGIFFLGLALVEFFWSARGESR